MQARYCSRFSFLTCLDADELVRVCDGIKCKIGDLPPDLANSPTNDPPEELANSPTKDKGQQNPTQCLQPQSQQQPEKPGIAERLTQIPRLKSEALSVVPPDSEKLELLKTIEQLQEIIESQKTKIQEQEKLIAKLTNGQSSQEGSNCSA